MNGKKEGYPPLLTWLIAGLPLVAAIIASFLPLRLVFQQALVGIVLIWFQASLMFGLFNE